MAKYSSDFKLSLVLEYLEGEVSLGQLADKYGFKGNSNQIRNWINSYQEFGPAGLSRSRNKRNYPVEFKLEAITRYESSESSYREIANEMGLNNPSLIANWRKIYRTEGFQGLSKKRGRPAMSKNKEPKKQSTEKNNQSSSADLEKRLQKLELEKKMLKIKNEYLEKRMSLRKQRQMKEKQESSKDSEKNSS